MSTKRVVSLPMFVFIAILIAIFFITPSRTFAATVNLLTADNFAVLAGAGITNTGATTITGDVGSSPTPTESGFNTITFISGTNHNDPDPNDAATQQAKTDLNTAYLDAEGRTPTTTYPAIHVLGGGETLTPGVYNDPSSFAVTGTLTLDGGGDPNAVFIFQAGSTLKMNDSSKIVLTGSAQSCNVFWQVGSSATFGTTAGTGIQFIGNLLANTSISDSGGTTVDGRLLAGAVTNTGAVTLKNTTVAKSTCTTPTPTPTPSSSSSSSSSSGGSGGTAAPYCPPLASTIVAPFILESRRISPTNIFFSWGPYSGTNTFNIQYGFEHGIWLYNTDVTGFSTTISALPPDQPIWVQIAGRSSCTIGSYGMSSLVGGTTLILPKSGNIAPIILVIGAGLTLLFAGILDLLKWKLDVDK